MSKNKRKRALLKKELLATEDQELRDLIQMELRELGNDIENSSGGSQTEELSEVIFLGMRYYPEIAAALFEVFDREAPKWKSTHKPNQDVAVALAERLCKAGSNSIESWVIGPKSYDDVVFAVGKEQKVDKDKLAKGPGSAPSNERAILEKYFSDLWDSLSSKERNELLRNMGLAEGTVDPQLLASSGLLATQILVNQYGGFAVYQMTVTVANFLARQLLGRGLTFAANAALTRGVALLAGPGAWLVSGLWLAHSLAGPAYTKVVPAVVLIGAIRAELESQAGIGVVGPGSAGKDACLQAVFGVDEAEASPISGATDTCQSYQVGTDPSGIGRVTNFPGFNDINLSVAQEASNSLSLCRGFVVVLDATSGISGDDVDFVDSVSEKDRPFLVCLNKWDLIRPSDREALLEIAQGRVGKSADAVIPTSFHPDERLEDKPVGVSDVRNWIEILLKAEGLDPKSFWG